jgi:hypothetical protein
LKLQQLEEARVCFAEAVQLVNEMRGWTTGLDELDRFTFFLQLRSSGPFPWNGPTSNGARSDTGGASLPGARSRSRNSDLVKRSRVDPLREAQESARRQGDSDLVTQLEHVSQEVEETTQNVNLVQHQLAQLAQRKHLDAMALERLAGLEEDPGRHSSTSATRASFADLPACSQLWKRR